MNKVLALSIILCSTTLQAHKDLARLLNHTTAGINNTNNQNKHLKQQENEPGAQCSKNSSRFKQFGLLSRNLIYAGFISIVPYQIFNVLVKIVPQQLEAIEQNPTVSKIVLAVTWDLFSAGVALIGSYCALKVAKRPFTKSEDKKS